MNTAADKTKYYREKWLRQLKEVVLSNVDKDNYAVFLFGSAVNNLVKAHDVDIGIFGKQKFSQLARIKIYDELEESIIPFKVDLVDFSSVNPDFKKIALEEIEIWNKPEGISLN